MAKPKYKQMYLTQKRMTFAWITVSLVLLFLLVIMILERLGQIQLVQAQENLWAEQSQASAQMADGFNKMYQTKPPVYAFPETNEEIIQAVFQDRADEALKIARCESGMRENARNPESSATGLFQIMASVHGVRRDWLENPIINTMIAKELYEASSWNPWVCEAI